MTIDAGGLRLRAFTRGNPRLPPLLLLHGGRDHARAWDALAVALARDRHVIAPDLRGHGDSDWSNEGRYDKQAHVGDMVAVTAALGAAPAVVVGHSLGANIALHYAAAFPERVTSLIAIEGMMRSPQEEAEHASATPAIRLRNAIEADAARARRLPRRYASVDAACFRLAERTGIADKPLLRHLAETGLRAHADGGWSWKHDPRIGPGPITDGDVGSLPILLGAIQCPVLLLYGEHSPASRPSRDGRLSAFRDAREVEVGGAGHWVQHDAPTEVLEQIRAFLEP